MMEWRGLQVGDWATWATFVVAVVAALIALATLLRQRQDNIAQQARAVIIFHVRVQAIGESWINGKEVTQNPYEVHLHNRSGMPIYGPLVILDRPWGDRLALVVLLRWLLRKLRRGPKIRYAYLRRMTHDRFGLPQDDDPTRNSWVVMPEDQMRARLAEVPDRPPVVMFRDAGGRRWLLGVGTGKLWRLHWWQGTLRYDDTDIPSDQYMLPVEALRAHGERQEAREKQPPDVSLPRLVVAVLGARLLRDLLRGKPTPRERQQREHARAFRRGHREARRAFRTARR